MMTQLFLISKLRSSENENYLIQGSCDSKICLIFMTAAFSWFCNPPMDDALKNPNN